MSLYVGNLSLRVGQEDSSIFAEYGLRTGACLLTVKQVVRGLVL